MKREKKKLVEELSEGDVLLFTNGGSPLSKFANVYEVIKVSLVQDTVMQYISSLDKNMVGRIIRSDLTAYYHEYGNVFKSNRVYRDKEGNITWKSHGRIEILSK